MNETNPLVDAEASTGDGALFDVASPSQPETKAKAKRKPKDRQPEHPRFPEFWSIYPLRNDRPDASDAFHKAVNGGIDPEVIIAGAIRYRDDPGRTRKFTRYGATWLNKASWDNEPRGADSTDQPRVASGNEDHWADEDADFGMPTNRSA